MSRLRQSWAPPSRPRPIVIVGAGGVVRTAHLPVYRRLEFPVAGLYDINPAAAHEAAQRYGIDRVFSSMAEAAASPDAVFDVAVPGGQITGVLRELPHGAPVLIQKPMGEDLATAQAIVQICRDLGLVAAINFQLRFSPSILALRDLVDRNALGQIVDIEVRLVVKQPWNLWTFLEHAPRVEILYHSLHYLDVIRFLVGEPVGVYCRAVSHPSMPEFRDTRSSIILDYGDAIRCSLLLNHTHDHDATHRASFLKIEGTAGAAQVMLGVNIDYPNGPRDTMEVAFGRDPWQQVDLRGSWFIEGFEGPMSNLQRFIAGEDSALVSPVDDAIRTMAVVEACYRSSAAGGTAIPKTEA